MRLRENIGDERYLHFGNTRGGKAGVETCVEKSTKKRSLWANQGFSWTKSDEMIDNSIEGATQTIAKYYSMDKDRPTSACSKEPEGKSRAFRFCREQQERWKYPSNVRGNRRAAIGTRYFSRRRDSLQQIAHSDPYPYVEMTHACTIPLSAKSKSKKQRNLASNVNADNRRMTGNVNIYICSETNDNGQAKGEQKFKAQNCIDASTEFRSSSRCVSSSSASLRKLINGIRDKRRKMRPSNSTQNTKERNDLGTVRDAETRWRKIRTTETSDSNEDGCQMDVVKLSDQEKCRDAISSVRDIRSCSDDASSSRLNLCRDLPNSVALPCDDFQAPSSCAIAIYPSKAGSSRFDDGNDGDDSDDSDDTADLSLSSVTDVSKERKAYRRKNSDDVCGITDSEYTVCDAIDSSDGWPLKSVYTDCADCFTVSDSEYRGMKFRRLYRKDIWEKPQQSVECSQGQQRAARQWSTCSCIAEEEEEDCRANVEKELPESLRPAQRTICSESARDAAVRVTSLNNADGDRKSSIFRVSECPAANCWNSTACEATFGNWQEPLKVTEVSVERLVARELPRDIAACETAGLREKPDFKTPNEAPEETICKILDSNLAVRDDDKDKLAKENTDGTNLSNNNKENVVNAKGMTVQPDDRRNNVALSMPSKFHFDGRQSAERRKGNVSYKRFNDPSSSNATETLENLVNREKNVRMRLSPMFRPMGSRFRSSTAANGSAERDFALNESKQSKEKVAEKSQERDSPKDTLLHRSLKKLLDVIRQRKATRQIKADRDDSVKRTRRDEEDDRKPRSISGRMVEINDYEKDRQDVGEGVYRSTRPPLAKHKHETAGNTPLLAERQEPKSVALATDATTSQVFVSKEDEKEADISRTNQTAPLKSKLLRIIAAKRSHLLPIETKDNVRDERVDYGEIPLERDNSAKVTKDATISVEPIVRDVSALSVQDVASKGVAADETTENARCPCKKVEEDSRKPIRCECGIHFEPNSGLRSVTERTERCNDFLEDCFRKRKQSEAKEDDVSPSRESPSVVCTHCRGIREECKYRQVMTRFHRCGTCECSRYRYSAEMNGRTIPSSPLDKCDKASMSRRRRVNCCRRRDKRCRSIERGRNSKKPMICLYCDNPRDECTCRAPMDKCPCCGLPSDVCDCHNDQGYDRARAPAREREHVGSVNKGGSIRVTSWRPNREIRRYFARNDLGPAAARDCRCYEKPKRLNVFSDVMKELQKKMNESVCCTRCRRNPCRCGG